MLKYFNDIEATHNIGFLRGYSKFNPIQFSSYDIREREALAVDISMETEGVGIVILVSEKYQLYTQYLKKV